MSVLLWVGGPQSANSMIYGFLEPWETLFMGLNIPEHFQNCNTTMAQSRNNIFIHHNKSSLNMGFCEISYGFDICEKKHIERAFRLGDSRTCKKEDRTLKNLIMAYNESRDYSAFTQIFAPMVDSYIENNTIIRTVEHPDIESNVFREHDPDNQAIDSPTKYRNNLVVLVSEKTRKGLGNQVYLGWPMAEFNHSNNLFFNLDSPIIVFSDNPAENKENAEGAIIANPLL